MSPQTFFLIKKNKTKSPKHSNSERVQIKLSCKVTKCVIMWAYSPCVTDCRHKICFPFFVPAITVSGYLFVVFIVFVTLLSNAIGLVDLLHCWF